MRKAKPKNKKYDIPPADLKDEWRLKSYDSLPDSNEDGEQYPNSPLDQIYHNMNHPKRSPWLTVASIEKTIPYEVLNQLHFLTEKQKETVKLHCFDRLSFSEIAKQEGITKQAVHQRFIRAKRIIFKKIDTVKSITNG